MLIILWLFVVNVALPQTGAYTQGLLKPMLEIVIFLAAITLMFWAAGLWISNNLASTIVGGIIAGIGYLCRSIFSGIGWLIKTTFIKVFDGSRGTLIQMGWNPIASNIVATIIAGLAIAIII